MEWHQQHSWVSCSLCLSPSKWQLNGHSLTNRGYPHSTTGHLRDPCSYTSDDGGTGSLGTNGTKWEDTSPSPAAASLVRDPYTAAGVTVRGHKGSLAYATTSGVMAELMGACAMPRQQLCPWEHSLRSGGSSAHLREPRPWSAGAQPSLPWVQSWPVYERKCPSPLAECSSSAGPLPGAVVPPAQACRTRQAAAATWHKQQAALLAQLPADGAGSENKAPTLTPSSGRWNLWSHTTTNAPSKDQVIKHHEEQE